MSATHQPRADTPYAESGAEIAARPKFARRPASFSRGTPTPMAAMPAPSSEADTPKLTARTALPALALHGPAHTAWQEDARFGVVMLVLVLLVNIALVYGLSHLPTGTTATPGPTQVTAKAPSMPQAVNRSDNGITFFTQPSEARRTLQQFNLRSKEVGTSLSVSPQDFPAPTARPLQDGAR